MALFSRRRPVRALLQSAALNPDLVIEPRPGLRIQPAEEALLKTLFRRYARLVVESEFLSGYSGARTLLALPIRADGRADAYTIAKIGDQESIRREFENYETFVKDTLPPITARIQEPPVTLHRRRPDSEPPAHARSCSPGTDRRQAVPAGAEPLGDHPRAPQPRPRDPTSSPVVRSAPRGCRSTATSTRTRTAPRTGQVHRGGEGGIVRTRGPRPTDPWVTGGANCPLRRVGRRSPGPPPCIGGSRLGPGEPVGWRPD